MLLTLVTRAKKIKFYVRYYIKTCMHSEYCKLRFQKPFTLQNCLRVNAEKIILNAIMFDILIQGTQNATVIDNSGTLQNRNPNTNPQGTSSFTAVFVLCPVAINIIQLSQIEASGCNVFDKMELSCALWCSCAIVNLRHLKIGVHFVCV